MNDIQFQLVNLTQNMGRADKTSPIIFDKDKGHTGQTEDMVVRFLLLPRVIRREDIYLMSLFFQFPPQGMYGSCDTVELREIGIGKDPDIQFCHLLF